MLCGDTGVLVFLAGDWAYKVKKEVKLDFLDQSTLASREKNCQREVRCNRRLSPDHYQGVLPLFETPAGWSFSGDNEPSEYCVRMSRLPSDLMLDRLVGENRLRQEQVQELAGHLATFYQSTKTSERIARAAMPAAIETNLRANLKAIRELKPTADDLDRIESAQLEFVGRNHSLLEQRAANGKVRDCHGDLCCEHICLTSPPTIFDCIEFRDRLRHVDILDDIAGLVVDLDFRQRSDIGRSLWSLLGQSPGRAW